MKTLTHAGLIAMILAVSAPARADSIYHRAAMSRGRSSLAAHTDDSARCVGDSLTVVIAETSNIANKTSRNMEKTTSRNASMSGSFDVGNMFGSWIHKLLNIGGVENKTFTLPSVDAEGEAASTFEGSADYDSSRTITDSITVTVHDVLPNGNLVVMGTRRRQVEGDVQYVQISGIVRLSDVSHGNTVLSSRIAEFQLVTYDRGQSKTFTWPGWLGRVLNVANPS